MIEASFSIIKSPKFKDNKSKLMIRIFTSPNTVTDVSGVTN